MGAIFTPEFSCGNKMSLIQRFQEWSGGKFDGDLMSIPIPQDAPAQVPRIILRSQDNNWVLEVTLERTNLYHLRSDDSPLDDPDAQNFWNYVSDFVSSYKREDDIRIQRLACITERVANIAATTPSQYIANTFCKDEYLDRPFNNTNTFQLHAHKKYNTFMDFNINSWVRIKSANLPDEERTPVLHVLSDINTYSADDDPDRTFDLEDIARFFQNVPDHLECVFQLYFPQ